MNANYAAQVQHLEVERAGYLEFVPEQIIPHRHSRFISETVYVVIRKGHYFIQRF